MILRHHFSPTNNTRLAHLCGVANEHLQRIAQTLALKLTRRDDSFRIEGPAASARQALGLLQELYALADRPISAEQVQLMLVNPKTTKPAAKKTAATKNSSAGKTPARSSEAAPDSVAQASPGAQPEPSDSSLQTRRHDLRARTPTQALYLRNIARHDITFGVGPAGTGKTYLAVACAVDALARSAVQRVVLTRPAVEAGEKLGFLPGDLSQKVDPYLRPLYDALYDLMGFERVQKAFERAELEIAPLAFMRGRTLNHAFVILDEAQNTTPEQMKMFLTRIGFGSKAVVTGDVSQIDLPKGHTSGLVDAQHVLRRVNGIAHTRFTSADVVRHPLVARIVDAYDAARNATTVTAPKGSTTH